MLKSNSTRSFICPLRLPAHHFRLRAARSQTEAGKADAMEMVSAAVAGAFVTAIALLSVICPRLGLGRAGQGRVQTEGRAEPAGPDRA